MIANSKYLDFISASMARGWFPILPDGEPVGVGDFGQMENLAFRPFGNIANLPWRNVLEVVGDHITISDTIDMRDPWRMEKGITTAIEDMPLGGIDGISNDSSTTGAGAAPRKYSFDFERAGSFIFQGIEATAISLLNWAHIAPEVTINLTQNQMTFRDVLVITDVATMDNWGLAIAANEEARLIVASADQRGQRHLAQKGAQIEYAANLAALHTPDGPPLQLVKALKLSLTQSMLDHIKDRLLIELLDGDPRSQSYKLANAIQYYNFPAFPTPLQSLSVFEWLPFALDDLSICKGVYDYDL